MAAKAKPAQQGGRQRCDAINYQQLLDQERVSVPEHLRESHNPFVGDDDLSVSRYIDNDFHQQENRHLWPNVWQFVCREENVAEAGDHVIYDIGTSSLIVTRQADGGIKAFINSCLHRGRALRTEDGNVPHFRCPFHGFSWHLDGRFKHMPCAWDFQQIDSNKLALPEVRVDTWSGFVFVNFNSGAEGLVDYLGVVPSHFERYRLQDAGTGVHVQKVIPCNWKLAHEAFLESFHTVVTHPQILTFTGDANTQYDTFGDHVSRMITPMSVQSPHLKDVTQQRMLRDILEESGRMAESSSQGIELPEGMTTRELIGEMNRQAFAEATGRSLEDATLSELQDAILYDIFPNMQVWIGYNGNIVYQFRPNGDDHESCIFDVRILLHQPPGQPKLAVPVHQLEEHEPFSAAPELGALGPVFDQDMGNLPYMMKGLKASAKGAVSLGSYQESRIRHLHCTIDKYLAAGAIAGHKD